MLTLQVICFIKYWVSRMSHMNEVMVMQVKECSTEGLCQWCLNVHPQVYLAANQTTWSHYITLSTSEDGWDLKNVNYVDQCDTFDGVLKHSSDEDTFHWSFKVMYLHKLWPAGQPFCHHICDLHSVMIISLYPLYIVVMSIVQSYLLMKHSSEVGLNRFVSIECSST